MMGPGGRVERSASEGNLAAVVDRLRKILELEQQKGYQDRAVVGGLDGFLERWVVEAGRLAAASGLGPGLQEMATRRPRYATLGPAERAEWLSTTLRWLQRLGGRVTSSHPDPLPPGEGNAPVPPQAPIPIPKDSRGVPSRRAPDAPDNLDAPITTLRGIDRVQAAKFAKLGVSTLRDLLYLFPRRHNDFSTMKRVKDLTVGAEESVVATIWQVTTRHIGSRAIVEAVVGDETGNLRAVWFNQPYLVKTLPVNAQVVLSGKVGVFRGMMVLESPEWELLESEDLVHTGRLVPVYPLTSGLYGRTVRRLVKRTVQTWANHLVDHLPPELRQRRRLLDLAMAVNQMHYPDSLEILDRARERLAFDELFLIQLSALRAKQEWQSSQPGNVLRADPGLLQSFVASLPFALTGAQQRVLQEILADLQRSQPMVRLLQGEVGSGKTVVAAAALLVAVANGFQAALMAPTEILAEQHYRSLTRLFPAEVSPDRMRPPSIRLLIGSVPRREKDELYERIAEGEIDVVVGTHAIIQEDVEFRRLGLAVVDEQHRFGVEQRTALCQKGYNPDLLVMTATPIPRSLALTLYGDLDLSVIDELPPGRKEIRTKIVGPDKRNMAYEFVRREVKKGRQAFVICPLVEESDRVEARAATVEFERLSRDVFPDFRVGLLHGRMKAAEKEAVMLRFRDGELDVLVSTSVVEVGIDVPNATVMVVEGAERFGLSQLHQFRGRVGRGAHESYCLLLADNLSAEASERLRVVEETQNGLLLAEEDLKLRGPGEFFGTRQSGLPDLRVARLTDMPLLEQARQEAERLLAADPRLERPDHRLLAEMVKQRGQGTGEIS